jgi:UDP-GlcNAc:undecaprenyl-phosphate/decaprenyl-phosphate GlcNAc-1-phosphate transferase
VTYWMISAVVSVVLALLAGWVVPSWAMSRLVPVLEGSGHLVTNYRGRRIPTGLGLVWPVWAASVAAIVAVVTAGLYLVQGTMAASDRTAALATATPRIFGVMPLLLVVGAFAFGLVDDVFGAGAAKGFRGHLRALREGRITTGGLKLFGIGLLAMFAASDTAGLHGRVQANLLAGWNVQLLTALAGWACSVLVIALSANLVNLTDLRPGRAIKTYSALAVVGVLLAFAGLLAFERGAAFPAGAAWLGWVDACIATACLAVLLLGPVFAVWRYDLGERAMLGDAGANAMGALAGFFLVRSSPVWLVAVFAIVLLALNLVSERVSYSKVIERVAFLRWIDGIGRLPAEPEFDVSGHGGDDGAGTGVSPAEGDVARRDGRS